MMNKNKKRKNQADEMLDFNPSKAVSSTDCTGLIPTPVTSDDQSEAYNDLYDVYQPDGYEKPEKGKNIHQKNNKKI
jgi:hypothetical protein